MNIVTWGAGFFSVYIGKDSVYCEWFFTSLVGKFAEDQ